MAREWENLWTTHSDLVACLTMAISHRILDTVFSDKPNYSATKDILYDITTCFYRNDLSHTLDTCIWYMTKLSAMCSIYLIPAFFHIRYMASMNITQYYMAGYIWTVILGIIWILAKNPRHITQHYSSYWISFVFHIYIYIYITLYIYVCVSESLYIFDIPNITVHM